LFVCLFVLAAESQSTSIPAMVFYFLVMGIFLAGLKSQFQLCDLYQDFIRVLQVFISVFIVHLVQREGLEKLCAKEKQNPFELLNSY